MKGWIVFTHNVRPKRLRHWNRVYEEVIDLDRQYIGSLTKWVGLAVRTFDTDQVNLVADITNSLLVTEPIHSPFTGADYEPARPLDSLKAHYL